MGKTLDVIRRAGASGLIVASLVGWSGLAAAGTTTTPPPTTETITRYSGRATVLDARINLLTSTTKVVLADTGEMDPTGATRDATVVNFDNPPPLEVHSKTAHAITSGMNNTSSSTAAVEKLVVKIPGLTITADIIESNAEAVCSPQSRTVATRGNSTLVNLKINGQGMPASAPPNTRIAIPGVATVILNEQTNPDVNTMTVSAIHVIVPGHPSVGSADIYVSRATAGILTCAATCKTSYKYY